MDATMNPIRTVRCQVVRWETVCFRSEWTLLNIFLAGVKQQPPMHQFRMRLFKLFWGWTKNTSSCLAQGFFSPLKLILLPCPGIFQPSKTHPLALPRDFSALFSASKFSPPTYFPPSYLPHLISCSLHLQSLEELMSLSSIEFRRDVNTRLEEGGELNVEGI